MQLKTEWSPLPIFCRRDVVTFQLIHLEPKLYGCQGLLWANILPPKYAVVYFLASSMSHEVVAKSGKLYSVDPGTEDPGTRDPGIQFGATFHWRHVPLAPRSIGATFCPG